MNSSTNGRNTPHQRLLYPELLAPPASVPHLAPTKIWGCIMDVGILRILSCTALQPAHSAGLRGLYAAGSLEGAFPTPAPKARR
jgi:hypothetical protein